MSSPLTGPRVGEVRRRVGPVAWCALEILADRPTVDGVVEASVRSIARELGVAKNTAHRAIAALVRAGLVDAVQGRSAGGRFASGRYRLHLHDLITTPTPTTPSTSRPRNPSTNYPHQLTLPTPIPQ